MSDRNYIKDICLNVIHRCKMRCKYCFADEGEYHGHGGIISIETDKKAIDYVVKKSGLRKNIGIDLFGETTLIMDTIKEIIKYARDNERNGKYNSFSR
ncbi:TPA: 4Fe-4S cluster-binding domain-containing protein [Clostridium sporogenes]